MATARRLGRALRARLDRTRSGSDRGFSILEAVVLFPLIFVMAMISVQAVLVWHARNVAEAAAQDALRAARGYEVPHRRAVGRQEGDAYLTQVGKGFFQSTPKVDVTPSPDTVTVHVTGTVIEVIPFNVHFTVNEVATGPIERLTG